jgi:putative membrane protein
MWCGAHAGLGWLGWTVMGVGMVAFWGLVAWAIVAMVGTKDSGGSKGSARPEDVLAGRLARGEISTDEYVRARRLIDAHPDPLENDDPREVV